MKKNIIKVGIIGLITIMLAASVSGGYELWTNDMSFWIDDTGHTYAETAQIGTCQVDNNLTVDGSLLFSERWGFSKGTDDDLVLTRTFVGNDYETVTFDRSNGNVYFSNNAYADKVHVENNEISVRGSSGDKNLNWYDTSGTLAFRFPYVSGAGTYVGLYNNDASNFIWRAYSTGVTEFESGDVEVDGSHLVINRNDGSSKGVQFKHGNVLRWQFYETGTVGTEDLRLAYYNNDGSYAGTAYTVDRDDGSLQIPFLSGSYSGGSAYVCTDNSGNIYASESACP